MRIGVISDIHSNLEAFEAVIAELTTCGELLCLGDIVGYGAQPDEVVDRLIALRPKTVLMGNHDYAVTTGNTSDFSTPAAKAVEWTRKHIKLENLRYLASLPASARIELREKKIGLFHGSPSDPLSEYVLPGLSQRQIEMLIERANAEIVLLGHTHVPMRYFQGNLLLADPGSVGQPRDGNPKASFAILSVSGNQIDFSVNRVEYDIDSTSDKILQAGLPNFLAERLYVGV